MFCLQKLFFHKISYFSITDRSTIAVVLLTQFLSQYDHFVFKLCSLELLKTVVKLLVPQAFLLLPWVELDP